MFMFRLDNFDKENETQLCEKKITIFNDPREHIEHNTQGFVSPQRLKDVLDF